jgi:hypothetical protein
MTREQDGWDEVTTLPLTRGDVEPEVGVEPTTFRLRAKRSASDWTEPDGNCLLMLGADSVWSDRVEGSLIVGMIKGMIIELSILGLNGAQPGMLRRLTCSVYLTRGPPRSESPPTAAPPSTLLATPARPASGGVRRRPRW